MTTDAAFREYFDYLMTRSRAGLAYRRIVAYPRICRHLRGHVIDVGCGIGDFLQYRPGTLGLDINPYCVERCRDLGLSAQLVESDRLPVARATAEGAVLDNVLEHIAEPNALVGEIKRVLAVDGVLIVGVPGPAGYRADPDHKRYYDGPALEALLRPAGFELHSFFATPFRFPGAPERLRQYCVYGVFHRLG